MTQIYNIFKAVADQHPDKTALISGDARFSYQEILNRANDWAEYLSQQHLAANQRPRVALLTEDPFHTITIALGIARLNGACIPTNPHMLPEQMLTGWQASGVTAIVHEPHMGAAIDRADAAGLAFIETGQIEQFTGDAANVGSNIPELWSRENDYLITLSSGSTGAPKPIVISQKVKAMRAHQTWALYDLTPDDVVLCASPFFHSLGQRLIFVPLLLGATLVFMTKFTPKKWLEQVSAHQVSFIISVSSHLYALKDDLLHNSGTLKSLKTIVTSSAPIDSQFKEQLFRKIGCNFHEIYGATEVAIATNLSPAQAVTKHATVGTPCQDVRIRIVDDHGQETANGTVGEIAVSSPLAFEGYYRQAEMTEAAMRDGFFLTGDLGQIDDEDFLTYVGRKKDVIISGGINIYPKDIEIALLQQGSLKEVAVIGIENELLGEVILAICITDGQQNIERELRRIANRKLAPFQRPLKYVFAQALPLTASGKVSKLELRALHNTGSEEWTAPLKMMLYRD